MINWIPVEERLPEKTSQVLVHLLGEGRGGLSLCRYSKRHKAFNASDFLETADYAFNDVTHWAEIDPPKGWENESY